LPVVVQGRAHDDIGEAVAVHVSGRGHAGGVLRDRLIALLGPCGSGRQSCGRAEVDVGASLVGLPVVVAGSAHDHVGEAVAVDVAGGAHAPAEAGARLIALHDPGRGGGEAGGRAQVHVGAALVGLPVVVEGSPDDQVRVAVAVDVA